MGGWDLRWSRLGRVAAVLFIAAGCSGGGAGAPMPRMDASVESDGAEAATDSGAPSPAEAGMPPRSDAGTPPRSDAGHALSTDGGSTDTSDAAGVPPSVTKLDVGAPDADGAVALELAVSGGRGGALVASVAFARAGGAFVPATLDGQSADPSTGKLTVTWRPLADIGFRDEMSMSASPPKPW